MKENIQTNGRKQLTDSKILFAHLEEHFGKATSNTVSRFYDNFLFSLQKTDPDARREVLITSHYYMSDFEGNGPCKYVAYLTSHQVNECLDRLFSDHHSLKLQIASEGGYTAGPSIDYRFESFVENLEEVIQAQKEIAKIQNQTST